MRRSYACEMRLDRPGSSGRPCGLELNAHAAICLACDDRTHIDSIAPGAADNSGRRVGRRDLDSILNSAKGSVQERSNLAGEVVGTGSYTTQPASPATLRIMMMDNLRSMLLPVVTGASSANRAQ